MSQVNPAAEFSSLVFGSYLSFLMETESVVDTANTKLEEIGKTVGQRLAHCFRCDDISPYNTKIKNVLESIIVKKWKEMFDSRVTCKEEEQGKVFTLDFEPSIFSKNFDMDSDDEHINYRYALCGIVKGILEMFSFECKVSLVEGRKEGSKIMVELEREIPMAVPLLDD